jgi:RNA polymerase sigma-70 factor, ECF subfamily
MVGGITVSAEPSMPSRVARPAEPDTARASHEADAKAGCACEEAEDDAFLAWVGRLVHQHRVRLAGVARREGLAPEDAFDAVQEAFQSFLVLPAARALAPAHDEAAGLLVTLVRNIARNRRRLHARARPHDSDEAVLAALPAGGASVEELVAAAEEQVRLEGCVATLADVQRAVVTLRMLDERPGEDVAHALGITPGHVAVLLHRAKANLLACMTAQPR